MIIEKFECLNCKKDIHIKEVVQCCACDFIVCAPCSEQKQCACDKTRQVSTRIH